MHEEKQTLYQCLSTEGAGHGVAEVVQPDILNAGLAPHPIPERHIGVLGPGGVPDGGEDPGAVALRHAAFDDVPRRSIQQDGSRPGLAVAEFEPVVLYLVPAETDDLVLAAAGQQQQADDVGLLRM